MNRGMTENKEKIYVAYEFGKEDCLISLISPATGKEPILIPSVPGGDTTRIPLFLAKKCGVEQWYYGQEAEEKVKQGQAVAAENFYEKAKQSKVIVLEEKEYQAELLLQMYLKKTFSLLLGYVSLEQVDCITFCVDKITESQVRLWKNMQQHIPFPKEKMRLISYSEGFAYYVMTQEESLWQRGVILLDYDGAWLEIKELVIHRETMPRVMEVVSLTATELEPQDTICFSLLKKVLEGKRAGMIYLVGKGFAGEWYQESLKLLCQGRRVFRGQNLYGMGALHYGEQRDRKSNKEYLYLGEEQVKLNITLPAIWVTKEVEYEFVSGEQHWYEAEKSLEVLVGESKELIFHVTGLYGGETQIKLVLNEFPVREERASRLRISVDFIDKETVRITGEDLGFGEIYPATEKVWKQEIRIQQLQEQLKADNQAHKR